MMIHKRLIGTVSKSRKYIAGNVALQWISLCANIAMILAIARLFQQIGENSVEAVDIWITAVVMVVVVPIRYVCTMGSAKMGFLSSKEVKKTLRGMIYKKLLRLGGTYKEKISTSAVVQVAVEGVDQLEVYFSAYLPQFFYSMRAPLTLFVVLCFINVPAAVVLLICVPLIPIAIAAVQTFAKKLLAKYWGQYTALGDSFLENLQGLTTLKIYQADERKAEEMDREAERFRKITMKVLTMQLNSVTVMDVIAYGGAALGVIIGALQFKAGAVTLGGGLAIILLSSDFFIPMRLLGSYFHIAMNGMAASDKIFALLDMPEEEHCGEQHFPGKQHVSGKGEIYCEKLCFSYDGDRKVLRDISIVFPAGTFTAIVGESGSGKSTVASILMGRSRGYEGRIIMSGVDMRDIREESLMKHITYIGFDSYIFKGSVRENLLMGDPKATEGQMWSVLNQVKLSEFLHSEQGLDTALTEKGANFSGGQRQRLALARGILHDSPVYIFDEATSNIDVESENEIMEQIYMLAEQKMVILITHRLANAVRAENIYVMQDGDVAESGTHGRLLENEGPYAELWQAQYDLECGKEEVVQ